MGTGAYFGNRGIADGRFRWDCPFGRVSRSNRCNTFEKQTPWFDPIAKALADPVDRIRSSGSMDAPQTSPFGMEPTRLSRSLLRTTQSQEWQLSGTGDGVSERCFR